MNVSQIAQKIADIEQRAQRLARNAAQAQQLEKLKRDAEESVRRRGYRAETAVDIAEATIRLRQQEIWADEHPGEWADREELREAKAHQETLQRQREHYEAELKLVNDSERQRIWRTEERPRLARIRAASERALDEQQLPYLKQPDLPMNAPDYFMPTAAKPHVAYQTQGVELVDGQFRPVADVVRGRDPFGRPTRELANPLTQGAQAPGEHPETVIRRETERELARRAKEQKA